MLRKVILRNTTIMKTKFIISCSTSQKIVCSFSLGIQCNEGTVYEKWWRIFISFLCHRSFKVCKCWILLFLLFGCAPFIIFHSSHIFKIILWWHLIHFIWIYHLHWETNNLLWLQYNNSKNIKHKRPCLTAFPNTEKRV